jgi:hypothetical protein
VSECVRARAAGGVCVCVCVNEREKERESVCVWVYVCARVPQVEIDTCQAERELEGRKEVAEVGLGRAAGGDVCLPLQAQGELGRYALLGGKGASAGQRKPGGGVG